MRSLRARLMLGSSLVAIVPLALAMFFLSRRVEDMVRTQAAERLSAALGGLQARIDGEGAQIHRRLEILGADPTLKRLYLLHPSGSRDLSEYLEERRFLLGLDFLQVLDTSGVVVSDGATMAGEATARGTQVERGPHPAALGRLEGSAALATIAAAPIPFEHEVAGIVRGGLALDAPFLDRLRSASGIELVLRDSLGAVVVSTLGVSLIAALPGERVERIAIAGDSYLGRTVALAGGGPSAASVTGLVSTRAADRTIARLQGSAALLGAIGLAIAVVLGAVWSSQVSRPVERLADFSARLARGEWDEPLALRSVAELETLVAALERMRRDLRSQRERLVISERQAAWSQMARQVAHEIKNPLTPIAVSVADLRRSYQLGRPDFPAILEQATRTVAEEVDRLKRLLQEFSEFGRFPPPRLDACRLWTILGDLGVLYGSEIGQGRLVLSRPDHEVVFAADAGQVRQALVNLVKNGLEATEPGGHVSVSSRVDGGTLELSVSDDGPGLDAEQRAGLFVPGFTTKSQGSGLGLTIVERIVSDHRGTIAVDTAPGRGTTFRLRLPLQPGIA